QVNIMRLKVDLGCHKCYKKVKKILCKFPQNQIELILLGSSGTKFAAKVTVLSKALKFVEPPKLKPRLKPKPPPPPPV
ncbi:hypothetical protein glysoja_042018, partial [Glycine soja]